MDPRGAQARERGEKGEGDRRGTPAGGGDSTPLCGMTPWVRSESEGIVGGVLGGPSVGFRSPRVWGVS